MRTKYKGHHNRNTQIRGTFSAGGDFLVCGSDDGWAYVWPTDAPAAGAGGAASGKRVRMGAGVRTLGRERCLQEASCAGSYGTCSGAARSILRCLSLR